MAELSAVGDTQWLNIAFNPSSWIADCFVRFYQIHEKENLHCQVHTGKMREVLERIHEYKDELGFLYVTTRQQTDLQYLLIRKQLEFIPLKEGTGHLSVSRRRIPAKRRNTAHPGNNRKSALYPELPGRRRQLRRLETGYRK